MHYVLKLSNVFLKAVLYTPQPKGSAMILNELNEGSIKITTKQKGSAG